MAFLDLNLIECNSCGRQNGKVIGKSCYGCGEPIPRESDAEKKARKSTSNAPAKGSANMRANDRTKRRMDGKAKANAAGVPEAPKVIPDRMTPILTQTQPSKVSFFKMNGKKLAIGAGAVVGITTVALAILYLSEKSKVHASLGRVVRVDENGAILEIPGLKDLELNFTNDSHSPEGFVAAENSAKNYAIGDLIDVYWSDADGVVAIVPRSLGASEHLRNLAEKAEAAQ